MLQGSPGPKGVEGTDGNQVSEFPLSREKKVDNTFEIHKQVKTSDIVFRRFGDLMTPLSRNE